MAAISPLFSNPFVFFFTQRTTIALLAAFTHPTSHLRSLIFPILIAWNIYLLPHYKDYLPTRFSTVVVCYENVGQILSYAEKILLRQWSPDTFDPARTTAESSSGEHESKPKPPHPQSTWTRLRFGTWLAFSTRYINTAHQAPKTPPYSTHNPTYIPTRASFLARKLLILAISYLITDILVQQGQPELNAVHFADAQIPLFTRLFTRLFTPNHDPHDSISAKELLLRVISSLAFWSGGYFVIQLIYGTLQLLTVALGLSSPAQERPIMGSITEVYTMRGFWGSFWHQMIRCRLTAVADWVTYDVLRLPRSGAVPRGRGEVTYVRLVARYTHLMCVFGLSGLMHHCIDAGLGIGWRDSQATQGFLLMGVGIVMEDAVQWVWFEVLGGENSRSANRDRSQRSRKGTWVTRAVGYFWVALWLSVATPYYAYPAMSRNTGSERDRVLPFSLIRYFRS